jgi:pimeloyl-ACP methyl ester carboxylesterase
LVVEEEMLPGVDAVVPEPGRSHYPAWHGPFNRAVGLAEALVPGREDSYYGTFLRQSAGPAGLSAEAERTYLASYRQPAALAATLGYYRTAQADREAVARRAQTPLAVPVLTVGGQFGMGRGVADCFAQVARHVDHVQIDGAGHYPAEQRADEVNARLVAFLAAGHSHIGEHITPGSTDQPA